MDDFFIGWQPEAPRAYARRSREFVIALAIFIPFLTALLVVAQRGFHKGVFEFGNLTELEGTLFYEPAPLLRLPGGQSLLLIGAGKHGAMVQLMKNETATGQSLNGKKVKLKGYLIYHDGKGLLELPEDENIAVVNSAPTTAPATDTLGAVTLCGEIADPKCFFGVMKPGEGKPHRSCAIRCIAGGIPPVLKVENDSTSNYYLIKGAAGEPIGSKILDYVADGIRITGRLEKHGDWLVLCLDPGKSIERERPYWFGEGERMCSGR